MRITCEFRVVAEYAHLLFGEDEGVRLGDSIRKVEIDAEDPRFAEIGRIEQRLSRTLDRSFFYGWNIRYHYSKKELAAAELFHIYPTAMMDLYGEECGTRYDYSDSCPECGVGRKLASDLLLDLRKAPKRKEIARTIRDDEIIVSERLAGILVGAKLTGFQLRPVRHMPRFQDDAVDLTKIPSGRELISRAAKRGIDFPTWEFDVWVSKPEQKELFDRIWTENIEYLQERASRRRKPLPTWHQLFPTSTPLRMIPPTEAGINPFDKDEQGEYRCPDGHVIGLSLLSEVHLDRACWDGSDVAFTENMVGGLRGKWGFPGPCLLVSPRFREVLVNENIKGIRTELAYLR